LYVIKKLLNVPKKNYYYKKNNITAENVPNSCGFICKKTFPADFPAHLPAKIGFLRILLWILLQSYLLIVCRKDAGDFFSFSAGNSAGKFPEDSKIRRKQLPTKVLAGNQNPQENPQETRFLPADFSLKLQENPQVINKILVV
jgi:hypothetical protein